MNGKSLLIGLTTGQLTELVADGANGKTGIEHFIEFIHEREAL